MRSQLVQLQMYLQIGTSRHACPRIRTGFDTQTRSVTQARKKAVAVFDEKIQDCSPKVVPTFLKQVSSWELSAPKSHEPLRLRLRFLPLPEKSRNFLRPQDARFPCDRKSPAKGHSLCNYRENDPHCGNSLQYLCCEKSLANGNVRFWCTQPGKCKTFDSNSIARSRTIRGKFSWRVIPAQSLRQPQLPELSQNTIDNTIATVHKLFWDN